MPLNSTFLEMVNHVLVRINQPELIGTASGGTGIAGASGRAKSIAQKFNDKVNELLLEADWWTHLTTRTFVTSDGVQDYAVASDFAKPIILIDTTSKREYSIVYPRAFELRNLASTLGGLNFYTLENNNYRLLPIPSTTVLTFQDVYWRIPAKMTVDTDKADLPPGHEFMLKEWVYGSISGDMGNYEAKDRANIDYFRTLNKAKDENSKTIQSLISTARQVLNINQVGLLVEGQTLPLNDSGF